MYRARRYAGLLRMERPTEPAMELPTAPGHISIAPLRMGTIASQQHRAGLHRQLPKAARRAAALKHGLHRAGRQAAHGLHPVRAGALPRTESTTARTLRRATAMGRARREHLRALRTAMAPIAMASRRPPRGASARQTPRRSRLRSRLRARKEVRPVRKSRPTLAAAGRSSASGKRFFNSRSKQGTKKRG